MLAAMLYVIPILLLALPDATAALVGGRYGQHRYHATAGDNSFVPRLLTQFIQSMFVRHISRLLAFSR